MPPEGFEPSTYSLEGSRSVQMSYEGMELDTVLGSNLSKYITPDLGIQLLALKEHMGVDSFAFA